MTMLMNANRDKIVHTATIARFKGDTSGFPESLMNSIVGIINAITEAQKPPRKLNMSVTLG